MEVMKKYLIEFAIAENFTQVDEWQTMDGLDAVEAKNAEEAAEVGANTDGLENALFRVWELVPDEFGGMEKTGKPEYFSF